MNRKTTFSGLFSLSLIVASFASCYSTQLIKEGNGVEYSEAQHYFLRNDVKDYSSRLVTTQKEFDSLFGAAAVMGENGLPTEIDWEKQSVVALMTAPTNVDTDIKLKDIKSEKGKLTVRYAVSQKGGPRSYSYTPLRLFVVSKNAASKGASITKE